MEFHTTLMGRRFIESTMPRVAENLERIASSLEKQEQQKNQSGSLSPRELATVLAGLRYLQEVPFEERITWVHFEEVASLDNDQIDELCERLNCGA